MARFLRIGLLIFLGVQIVGLIANACFVASFSADDDLPAESAILVLGGPRLQQRLEAGVAAFHLHGAEYFVVSSERVADEIAGRAEDRGVPREIILLEPRARSTLQNALFVRELLPDTAGPIIIVTQRVHLLRAAASFRWAGFEDIYLFPSDPPSDYLGWRSTVFFIELAKWEVNLVRAAAASFLNAIGWNLEDYQDLLI